MMDISRRTALGLIAAVAAPSAGAVAVAAVKPVKPMTVEEFLAIATPAERVRYHSNMLMEAMAEMHPDWQFRSHVDHQCRFALVIGDRRDEI